MQRKTRLTISLIINLAIVVMEIIGAALSVSKNGWSSGFQFYTEDSNLIALFACGIMAAVQIGCLKSGKAMPEWVQTFKYLATCCLAVTFVVVLVGLAPAMGAEGYKQFFFRGSALYMHLLCPLCAIFGFIFFDTELALKGKHTWIALIPTVIYAVVSTLLNVLRVMEGPYPFLYVYEQPVWMSCLWFVIIVGGALLLAWLLRIANTKRAQHNR